MVVETRVPIAELVQALEEAEQNRVPIAPFVGRYPDITVVDAYAVQQAVIQRRVDRGARIVGRKVGLTNAAIQRQLGVSEPDFGCLLDDMLLSDGAAISMQGLIQPKVEPEVAFILREPLQGPGVTPARVLLATAGVLPSLEIIDSRIVDWKIALVDTVADNGSSARCVLGNELLPVDRVDLRLMGMVLEKNGELAGTGASAAALGHPAAAVAWLANTLGRMGQRLEAGDVVLPGGLCAAPAAQAGDVFEASFQGLGSVRCRFVP